MLTEFSEYYSNPLQNFYTIIQVINGLLHLVFAAGVAKDIGKLRAIGQKPILVSGVGWAFATLVGGVITAILYWFIHHSTLTRPIKN